MDISVPAFQLVSLKILTHCALIIIDLLSAHFQQVNHDN